NCRESILRWSRTSSGTPTRRRSPVLSATRSWRRRSMPGRAAPASGHYLDALPEGDLSGDVGGSRLRVGIVPRGVDILATADHDGVVERRAFPGTYAGGLALAEVLPRQGFWRKVVVSLDHVGLPRFRDHDVVPDGFRHDAPPHARCDDPGTARPSMSVSGR